MPPTRPLRRRLATALLATLPLACAPAAGPDGPSPERVPSATMTTRTHPEFRFPSVPREGRALDLQIQVTVDPLGRPDLGTLRVTGLGAAENAEVVKQWIQQSRFRPATRDGQPVTSLYRTRFEVRVGTRRISD